PSSAPLGTAADAPGASGAPSASPATSATPGAATTASPGDCRCEDGTLRCAGRDALACHDLERCDAAAARCAPACPEGEVYVPATGPEGFVMGANLRNFDGVPHKVVLTRPFCMDASEVTAAAYTECIDAHECTPNNWWGSFANGPRRPPPEGQPRQGAARPTHPINNVDWHQAKHYCELRGKTLPTEAQWEWAATGGDGRKWPWGDELPDCEHADYTQDVLPTPSGDAGCHGGGTSPVGAHSAGDRVWPTGALHDLAGNVWEWCLDNYEAYSGKDEVDPLHLRAEHTQHMIRGGGWNRSHLGIRAQYRGNARVDYRVPGLGFRCVRNPK
ncbi:MAG: SUMF1/EgtB/PvdO family nonheme iron enzyme, partial [Myxococcales bacterium]|nr:SUMF1/EgtB/PvdO family nonheme iron enzyme [Myxococcales bacterium]